MAKESTNAAGKTKENKTDQAQERQTRVRWDTSDMRNTYANVCNVTSTREEVMLLFGTNQTWFTGQEELSINLSDRIILNPFTAKRLAMLLNNVLSEYEARFGKLPVDAGEQPEMNPKG